MIFTFIKWVHIAAVSLSISGFVLRGIWMMLRNPMLSAKWVKITPHIIDTVLLASAVALMFEIQQYPFKNSWLTAKLFGLVAYILFGMIALRFGKTMSVKISAWIAALITYSYIVAVAVSKSPW